MSIFAGYLSIEESLNDEKMIYTDEDYRREELIRNIERQIGQMTLRQLEMLYYELSTKDYSSYVKPPKVRMDYVIMFVPHSGALWTVLNAQPDLWRRAMDRNVFIADEQTLFAALRIINLTWTQIVQQQISGFQLHLFVRDVICA